MYDNEMCSFCRMAISQLGYAAELIDRNGAVFKFDDIGCMLHFAARRDHHSVTPFVIDHDTRRWLAARDA